MLIITRYKNVDNITKNNFEQLKVLHRLKNNLKYLIVDKSQVLDCLYIRTNLVIKKSQIKQKDKTKTFYFKD